MDVSDAASFCGERNDGPFNSCDYASHRRGMDAQITDTKADVIHQNPSVIGDEVVACANGSKVGSRDGTDICSEITWLDVPFREKEAAKLAGARWDSVAKCWYAPAFTDRSELRRWIEEFRIYLTSEHSDRERIKSLGGRWDLVQRKWYISADMNPSPFSQWIQ